MSEGGQQYLLTEIRRAIDYAIDEYDITWPEVIGCLYMGLHYITTLAYDKDSEDEETEIEEDEDVEVGEEWKKGNKPDDS